MAVDREVAGAPGFEPGITGPKPVALPLGHAPSRRVEVYRRSVKTKNERDERDRCTTNTIAVQTTIERQDRRTSTARSCDAAKIQETWRNVSERVFAPAEPVDAEPTTATTAMTVHSARRRGRPRRGSPSAAAIQSAMRMRRARSHRPASLVPCSIACDESMTTHQPYHAGAVSQVAPAAFSARCAASRAGPVVEEPVDRRAGAADVGAEGAERAQLVRERRRSRGRSRGSAARSRGRRTARERGEERGAALLEAGGAVAAVEGGVDGRGRRLLARRAGATSSTQKSCGRSSGSSVRAVAGAELRAVGEEERDVGAERRGELVQLRRPRAAPASVAFASRSAVAASELPPPSPAATGSRFSIAHVPARLDAGARGERLERGADERVVREALDARARRAGSSSIRSASPSRW